MAVLKRCDCGGVGVCPVCLREDRDAAEAAYRAKEAEVERLESDYAVARAEADTRAEEVERLREALSFYADPKTWDHISERGTVTTSTAAKRDNGDKAREVLGA